MHLNAEIQRAVRASAVGELAWIDLPGRPAAHPVTPLLLDDRPAISFPYAEAELARRIAAGPVAALLLSDDRLTGRGWLPVALTGRPRLIEDRDGALFTDRLLAQELRKYPPARALADSPLLRREHWWYLPRLIVVLDVVSTATVGARTGGAGEVLAVAAGDHGLCVDTVDRVDPRDPGEVGAGGIRLASRAVRGLPSGPAVLLGHDFSAPDLERWTPWTTRGRLAAATDPPAGDTVWTAEATLTVDEAPERTALAPPLGLWQRLTRHRRLEKVCRRALASG